MRNLLRRNYNVRFNKITVTPQLPDRIKKLATVAGNLWWTWNTDFLKLFKQIDGDLWETVGKKSS